MKFGTCSRIALLGALSVRAHLLPRQTDSPSSSAAAPEVTAITACHAHGSDAYCMNDGTEYRVHASTKDLPKSFTDCHSHGSAMYCVDSSGEDVAVDSPEAAEDGDHDHDHDHEEEGHEEDHDHEHGAEEEEEEEASGSRHCHFHAGVEHCVGGEETESTCEAPNRDYNVPLRVGLLFVIMATSALGVYSPILLQRLMPNKLNTVFTVMKQFGTGIIISTAFVHLYTHASLMFGNDCLGELEYEGTTAAILMAGLFLSFLVEYVGNRVVLHKVKAMNMLTAKDRAKALLSTETVSILVMELGIIFHSLLIGLTLVVAGDEFFITLFIVILFHQMFEGIALGSRIATIGTCSDAHGPSNATLAPLPQDHTHEHSGSEHPHDKTVASHEDGSNSSVSSAPVGLSLKKKLALAGLFAFITPLGMAIGIGVLQHFNGNDKATLIAIGTLDALSAGILVWVGVVEMWAADWMTGGHGHKAELADAPPLKVALSMFGLISGLVLMSLLGKWA